MAHRLTVYRSGDEDPDVLSGETVAVIGYGNLGSAVAQNLRDSGLAVVVGNIHDDYRPLAEADRFQVADISAAVARADLTYVLIPDEEIPPFCS